MTQGDDTWLAIVSVLVWVAYLDHLYHAIRLWVVKERSYRAFRNAFIAVMLQVGLTRIVLGAAQIAFPDSELIETLRDVTAPILTLFLLSGAGVLAYTWRKDEHKILTK